MSSLRWCWIALCFHVNNAIEIFNNMNNMYWNTTQNAISGAGNSTEQLISLGVFNTFQQCQEKFISSNYRSFIYFNSNYSINSFRNYCYVRSDTYWNPSPQNDVISGRIDNFTNCRNNFECELNGKCIDNKCQCKPWFTGDFCQYLNFKKGSKNYGYQRVNYSQWGGSIIFDENTNTFNIFAAEMIDECGITTCCCCNSQIVLATSQNVSGPYKYKNIVKPHFAHEPNIIYNKNADLYLLYHWGDASLSGLEQNKSANCSEGYTHGPPTEMDIFDESHTMNYISFSNDLYDMNQWENNMILMQGDDIQFDLCPSNPYIFDNGSILQCWIERVPGTNQSMNETVYTPTSYIHLMTANSWNESYSFSWKPLWITSLMDESSVEDPFLWRDEIDDTFHLLMHGCTPINYTGIVDNMDPRSAGRHAFSVDGINWTLSPHYTYNTTICYDDGDCIQYGRRERPHLIFDTNTNQPIYLSTAIQIYSQMYWDKTFLSIVPLNTASENNHASFL